MHAHRPHAPAWLTGCIGLVAVLAIYFAVPVHPGQSALRIVVGMVLTLAAIGVVGAVLIREEGLRNAGRTQRFTGLRLVLLLEMVMVLFSLAYYHLAVDTTGEMAGLHTRIDALYFTATVMTTVGFGDIRPVGQVARALVAAHLVFDVAFVAAFAGLFRSSLAERAQTSQQK